MEYTGCDGVMSSEALLENPKLFNVDGDRTFRDTYMLTQLQTTREYLNLVDSHGPHARLPGPNCKSDTTTLSSVRAHLFKFLHRFLHSSKNKDQRDELLHASSISDMLAIVHTLDQKVQGLTDYQAIQEELLGKTTWYRRHRDSCISNNDDINNNNSSKRQLEKERERERIIKTASISPHVLVEQRYQKQQQLKQRLLERKLQRQHQQ